LRGSEGGSAGRWGQKGLKGVRMGPEWGQKVRGPEWGQNGVRRVRGPRGGQKGLKGVRRGSADDPVGGGEQGDSRANWLSKCHSEWGQKGLGARMGSEGSEGQRGSRAKKN
jgi:hypothetical protein